MTTTNGNGAVGELRRVALSRIQVQPDFNPRASRDPKRFAQLVTSVREEGVLQPLLVSGDGDGGFRLIAGEGRYLAAGQAGVVEVPVLVREVDERTGGLELALAENLSREDLDPVQEARAFGQEDPTQHAPGPRSTGALGLTGSWQPLRSADTSRPGDHSR